MSSLLEQSLQFVLQETTAIGVLAVLTVGLLGVSIRRLVGAGGAREADPGQPSGPSSEDVDRRILSDGGGRQRADLDEEEFEQRLDTLESEVDHLSSTVQSVQTENEEIAESVEEVNGNLQRLLDLSGSLARGINPFSSPEESPDTLAEEPRGSTADEPEDAFQRNARQEANPDVNHTDGEPVNRHQPVQHDKVETVPGGTGAAEGFDRMEEEVEELDTLSFSDDVEGGFGEPAEEDLGTEEVIAGSEPAPTEGAIGDGGTLIETKEEELDIEPGSVSEPATPTDSQDSPPADSQPDVESGFEFGAKAAESESVAPDDESTESADEEADTENSPGEPEDSPAPAEPATSEETAEFEELAAEVEESTETANDGSTPLDDQTEAELAAAEAAFAAEFDAEDDISLDLDTPAESPESDDETQTPADDKVETAGSDGVEESPDSRSIFDFESVAEELDESNVRTEELDESRPATEEPTEFDLETEEPAESSPATEEPEPSVTAETDTQSVSLEPEGSAEEQQTNAETVTGSEPPVTTRPSARSLGEHLSVTEGGKPYIQSLPEGYSAELLVVEWLESLVDDIGVHGTARAIQYYESLEWITADVAEQLDAYLHAFESGDADTLGADQHLRSLEYVDELARSESEDNE